MIDQPTYVINNFSSCIVLVFASNSNVTCNLGVELSLFDKCHHILMFGKLNFMIPLLPAYKRQVWDYKKTNAECIRRSISSVDWNFLFQGTSVNQKVVIFNKHLMNVFHNFIPNKIIKTDDIISRLRERSKMTKKYYKYSKIKSHLQCLTNCVHGDKHACNVHAKRFSRA